MRIVVIEPEASRPMPFTLVTRSNSISGGGLIFNAGPWVLAGSGVLVLSALFWIPLVHGITRTVSQMTAATERIALGNFQTRVTARRRDELGSLGEAVNRLAERLEHFVSGQKRFLGDIAHELCSPIARLQMALGLMEEQRLEPEQRGVLEDFREEVEQMSALVNELLSFSKASLGQHAVRLENVPLLAAVEKAVKREGAEDAVIIRVPPELQAQANEELLLRALANLVRNAVRYAGHAGPVAISSLAQDAEVILEVADAGPGIPEAELLQIFDPFYRPDSARDRQTGGAGLGLAIVKTCVEACGGTVSARNGAPAGLIIRIALRKGEASGRAERNLEKRAAPRASSPS